MGASSIMAQNDSLSTVPKNEIGITPFTLEISSPTLSDRVEPKFFIGAYYNSSFKNPNWSFQSLLRYGENRINDDCNCADGMSGRGTMSEFLTSASIRYTLFRKKKSFVQPFIQLGVHYSYIRYEGTFYGGWMPFSPLVKDDKFHGFGINGSTGVKFLLGDHFTLTIQSQMRLSFGTLKNSYQSESGTVNFGVHQPFGIRIGYRF